MNKIVVFFYLILIISCKSSVKNKISDQPVHINQIKDFVGFLTSEKLKGRKTGTKGAESAALFIENVFIKNNIKPYFETYRDTFLVEDVVGYNLVGFIEGNDPKLKSEIVIIGAHYDHIGFQKPIENDSIANGANDNASGTSAVLAIAEYFSKLKTNKRSLMICLFSGEELGILGSKHLSSRLKETNLNLYMMLNFEMIGVPLKDRNYDVFVTGYELSNMAEMMNAYSGSTFLGKSDFAVKNSLFKRSDNYSFYEAFQVPCQSISSCDLTNFDYYHHVDDEIDKLDFDYMSKLINTIIPALEKACNSATREIKLYNE